jgi:hypothetical protein
MNSNKILSRGTEVIVIAYGGKRLRRRVWEDVGEGVLICTEEEYQRAMREQDEANSSGFPKEDVLEVQSDVLTESA